MDLRRFLWVFVGLLAQASLSWAVAPPGEPMLRIETGMHTAMIRRIVVDARNDRLITAADDKTIRVWQMPGQRLITTLRVPMGEGHEGRLLGLALSPDGRTVAAGGWTGWNWEGKASVYVFDTASGEMVRRIGGLRDAVHALAWSPDGKHLAIGLQGRAGLDVVRVADGQTVASDLQYLDKLMDLDFGRDGRLAAVALDGMVRLYDDSFRLLGRRKLAGGSKPVSVRFAPDGDRLAVGFADVPVAAVASGRDLSPQYQADIGGLSNQASFLAVTWSSDGQFLYAAGDFRGAGQNPLYRWSEQGKGRREAIPLTSNRITEIQQMTGGRIAYAAEDPGFGIIGTDGRRLIFRGPDIHDFSAAHGQLRVSADGTVIQYPVNREATQWHTFAVLGAGGQTLSAPPAQPVAPPRLESASFRMENWRNGDKPLINGKLPRLDDYEMVRSYALTPDSSRLLLGTEWALRLVDQEAKQIWNVSLPCVAWSVNVTENGQLAVAALSDGTIRWYDMGSGREILAYFAHGNGRDWISWISDGYYASSIYGDNFVGWHFNRGQDRAADFYRAVQFDRILYRPDVVASRFRSVAQMSAPKEETAVAADFRIDRLNEIAPPRLVLRSLTLDGAETGRPRLKMQLQGERLALPMKDYTVFVNNIPVTPRQERRLIGDETSRFTRSLELELPRRENEIRVEAFNGVSMGVAETFVNVMGKVEPRRTKGNLYLLGVGVNNFPNLAENAQLAFAAKDAREIAKTLKQRAGGQFREVFVRTLVDGQPELPTRALILAALEFIQGARAEDTVIIYLASHGVADAAGNYYFVPRDVRLEDVAAAYRGKDTTGSLIHWTDFSEALRSTSGRRILIVDTCHARGVEGGSEMHSLMKRSAASLFPILVAAKSDEESQEYEAGKHGLFTYALISSLISVPEGKKRQSAMTLRQLFDASATIVHRLRDRSAGPQTPQLVAPGDLGEITITGD
jgi:WD40 repeat protein